MKNLSALVSLSHEFGTPDHVKGGGGNTSYKDGATLWIKPSGTTLAGIAEDSFVAVDRAMLTRLYTVPTPSDADAREAQVKELMLAAVRPDSSGRPSVEAPLHDSFDAAFVVHVHPPLVNGMTCARRGEAVCKRLFPHALWIPYTDPGYNLCMACRRAMDAYVERYGCQPRVMFLQNHGVITIGDAPSEIREIYAAIRNVLEREYAAAGIDTQLAMGAAPSADQVAQMAAQLRTVLGGKYAAEVCASGPYPAPAGPIMPDHILHCRSYHLSGDPTPDAIARFHSQHGHLPFVISCDEGVFGTGPNQRAAALALQFSQDGAQIIQLAKAFGGIRYMDDRARDFIENWEVEAYRRKLVDDARGPNVQ